MKAFIVSIAIIFLIFALTVINSIYISHTTDVLLESAKALEIGDGSVERFSTLWDEKQFVIRISSSHDETHKIDEVLAVLKAKDAEGSPSGFSEERALLVEYLTQIHEDETVSFDSII